MSFYVILHEEEFHQPLATCSASRVENPTVVILKYLYFREKNGTIKGRTAVNSQINIKWEALLERINLLDLPLPTCQESQLRAH